MRPAVHGTILTQLIIPVLDWPASFGWDRPRHAPPVPSPYSTAARPYLDIVPGRFSNEQERESERERRREEEKTTQFCQADAAILHALSCFIVSNAFATPGQSILNPHQDARSLHFLLKKATRYMFHTPHTLIPLPTELQSVLNIDNQSPSPAAVHSSDLYSVSSISFISSVHHQSPLPPDCFPDGRGATGDVTWRQNPRFFCYRRSL